MAFSNGNARAGCGFLTVGLLGRKARLVRAGKEWKDENKSADEGNDQAGSIKSWTGSNQIKVRV